MDGHIKGMLEQFLRLQYELPLFIVVIVFFVPVALVSIGTVLFFAGGFVAGAKLPLLPSWRSCCRSRP